MKRNICIFITFILLITAFMPVYGEEYYKDISSSHWAYSYVKEMSDMKIISGYNDGSFRPDRQVTYGEFIKMMYISQTGIVLEQPKSPHWAFNYYNEGLKIGLYTKNDISISELDNVIPRKIMALMVGNSIPIELRSGFSEWKSILNNINDVNEDSEYGYEISLSYSNKLLNGYPDNSFRPESGLSRAESAAAIFRTIMLNEKNNIEKNVTYVGRTKVKNRDFDVDEYETEFGYNGIKKVVYSEESDCIGVYSDRIQDINLFIDGNKMNKVVNSDNNYWKEDGYYVYVFNADGLYKSGIRIGVSFGFYIEEVYYFSETFK